jgi:hypothetical protein
VVEVARFPPLEPRCDGLEDLPLKRTQCPRAPNESQSSQNDARPRSRSAAWALVDLNNERSYEDKHFTCTLKAAPLALASCSGPSFTRSATVCDHAGHEAVDLVALLGLADLPVAGIA